MRDNIVQATVLAFLFIALFSSCASIDKTQQASFKEELTAIKWNGDGGKGKTIDILPPEASGFEPKEDGDKLTQNIQSLFNVDFLDYSSITVTQIAYSEINDYLMRISDSPDFEKDRRNRPGQYIDAEYYITGKINKTRDKYNIELVLNHKGKRTIVHQRNKFDCQYDEIEPFIHQTAAAFLIKLDVDLFDNATEKLASKTTGAIKSELYTDAGDTARNNGSTAEALFYYYRSVDFDPKSMKAAELLKTSSDAVRDGDIITTALDDYKARQKWLGILENTASFFNKHYPFEITYAIMGRSETNYKTGTADFTCQIGLRPIDAGFKAMNDILTGLINTKHRDTWGFSGWPFYSAEYSALVFGGMQSIPIQITVALMGENDEILAKKDISLQSSYIGYHSGEKAIKTPAPTLPQVITLSGVNLNKLRKQNAFVIVSINGQDAKQAIENGYIGLAAMKQELTEINTPDDFEFEIITRGRFSSYKITKYKGVDKDVMIPEEFNDTPITEIGEDAFRGMGITSIIIPGSVTSIGSWAFANNKLREIIIPGVTTVDYGAFEGNNIEVIVIPGKIKFGEVDYDSEISAFPNGFDSAYTRNGRKPGIYTYDGEHWNVKTATEDEPVGLNSKLPDWLFPGSDYAKINYERASLGFRWGDFGLAGGLSPIDIGFSFIPYTLVGAELLLVTIPNSVEYAHVYGGLLFPLTRKVIFYCNGILVFESTVTGQYEKYEELPKGIIMNFKIESTDKATNKTYYNNLFLTPAIEAGFFIRILWDVEGEAFGLSISYRCEWFDENKITNMVRIGLIVPLY